MFGFASFSFTPGFSPVLRPLGLLETVLTVSFEKQRKTVETVFHEWLLPGTGLKPGVNERTFETSSFLVLKKRPCTVRVVKAPVLYLTSLAASMRTVTLYRPVGPKELALIKASGYKEFPPRLPEQPIFYPVMNEEYAIQIARDWNVTRDGAGYVTRFEVDAEFVKRYPVQTVGSSIHQELWVPAEDLSDFNRHIVGLIEVIARFLPT